jgi:hypothetical protein
MKKGWKLLCAVGAGLLASATVTLFVAIQQGGLPDTCTVSDLLFAIRHSGGWGNALVAFAIVARFVDAALRPGGGTGPSDWSMNFDRPREWTQYNNNGSVMYSPGADVTGRNNGDTRI